MQQATSSIDRLVSTAGTSLSPKAASPPRFVVNLCASTTPVGLVQPTHAGLKRFTFFVSRRLEEGRERFRLHMGYFDSQEEAERILDLVRDVYPAAWAGVAPGIKLRARAALPEPASAEAPVKTATAPPPAAPPPAPVVTALKLELAPDVPRARPAVDVTTDARANDATNSLSDVRATIASLGDPAADARAPAGAVLEGAAVLRLLTSGRPAPAARVAPAPPVAKRNAPNRPAEALPPSKPTTPLAPQVAAPPEPALFAVQLLWSVQPIDMSQVPQLAIFSAYTLYGAEGNRDGRRWYGLRLGFFTDAVSAKQVSQYVRSEFSSVSVVPVTERERTRAGAATAQPLPAPAPARSAGPELNFIDEGSTDTATGGRRPAMAVPAPPVAKQAPTLRPAAVAALGMTSRPTPGKRAKARVAQGTKPISKRPIPNRPLSLEETLEILGAGDLQMESGRGELLNDSSRRDRKKPSPSGSRFGRLINRLAERLGNS